MRQRYCWRVDAGIEMSGRIVQVDMMVQGWIVDVQIVQVNTVESGADLTSMDSGGTDMDMCKYLWYRYAECGMHICIYIYIYY
jgi:hypothetical protein